MRAKVVQQHKAAAEDARRNHDVGVDGPIGNSEPAGQRLRRQRSGSRHGFSSPIRSAARTSSRKASSFSGARRTTKPMPRSAASSWRVAQALLQKVVVAQVGVGVVGNDTEVDDDWKAENVCLLRWLRRARDYRRLAMPAASSRRRRRRPCAEGRSGAPGRGIGWRARRIQRGFVTGRVRKSRTGGLSSILNERLGLVGWFRCAPGGRVYLRFDRVKLHGQGFR